MLDVNRVAGVVQAVGKIDGKIYGMLDSILSQLNKDPSMAQLPVTLERTGLPQAID